MDNFSDHYVMQSILQASKK